MFGPRLCAAHALVPLHEHFSGDRVEQHLHTGVGEQRIGDVSPHERIMDEAERLAVAHRRRESARSRHPMRELVGKSMHQLLRRAHGTARHEHAANGARHSGDRTAAAKAVPFDKRHTDALPCCGHRRRDAGGAASDDEHIGLDALDGTAVDDCALGIHWLATA